MEESSSKSDDLVLDVVFHDKQTEAHRLIDPLDEKGNPVLYDPLLRNLTLCYGGARGGGKSFWLAWEMLILSELVCNFFKLQTSTTPIPIGFIGRQRGADFTKTTLETIKEVFPKQLYTIREQKGEFIYRNRVKWFFGGLDNQDGVSKFTSMELLFILLDQAEEIDESDIGDARGALRRKIKRQPFPTRLILTANPRECWLKQEIIPPWGPSEPNYYFVQALPSENEHLPDGYLDVLRQAYKHDPAKLKAMLEGDWDILTGARKILTLATLQQCFWKNNPISPEAGKEWRVMSIDPSRYGDDKTVIYLWLGWQIKEKIVYGKTDLDALYGKILDLDNDIKEGIDLIIMDEGGIGAGPSDRLAKRYGNRYIAVNSASTEGIDTTKFKIVRHKLWFDGMMAIKDRKASVMENDKLLTKQLTAVEYLYDRYDRWTVESKDEMKVTLKGSPDEADSFNLGVKALLWLEIPENLQKIREAKWKTVKPAHIHEHLRLQEEQRMMNELVGDSDYGMLEG